MLRKFTVLLIILILLLCGCSGNVTHVKKQFGSSDISTKAEINSAMNAAIKKFKQEFDGCTLTEIAYEESISLEAAEGWA